MVYVCINCGALTDRLIVKDTKTVDTIDLKSCEQCGKKLDKYLEYDIIIVIIDMVLMKRSAYRHLVYNAEFKNQWRMAVLMVLAQGFFNWSLKCSLPTQQVIYYDEKLYGTFLLQMSYYCFINLIGFLIFNSVIICILQLYILFTMQRLPELFNCNILWRAMTLGNFQQFLLITPIIWQVLYEEPFLLAIKVYQFLSLCLAFSVISKSSWFFSASIIGFSLILETSFCLLMSNIILGPAVNPCVQLSLL